MFQCGAVFLPEILRIIFDPIATWCSEVPVIFRGRTNCISSLFGPATDVFDLFDGTDITQRRQDLPKRSCQGTGCSSNGEGSNGGSWSTRPSWRGASESSAHGCTPTRSRSAAGRSHGFASIRNWRRRCCGGLTRNRLTRSPARVSERVSLRDQRERRSCFQSEGRGRTCRPRRLR